MQLECSRIPRLPCKGFIRSRPVVLSHRNLEQEGRTQSLPPPVERFPDHSQAEAKDSLTDASHDMKLSSGASVVSPHKMASLWMKPSVPGHVGVN
jgi:hypothetical protein